MFLTKRYFKNFQYVVVAVCVFMAAFVGSIQTAFIIFKCSQKTGRKSNAKKEKG